MNGVKMKLEPTDRPIGVHQKPTRQGLLGLVVGLLIFLAACSPVTETPQIATVDPGPFYTQAAQTMAADLTLQAPTQAAPDEASATSPASPTSTADSPPATVPPTLTDTPSPTDTPAMLPTDLSTPTQTIPSPPSPTPLPCNQVQFLGDISAEASRIYYPGEEFVKTWLIYNDGRCEWNPGYAVQFVSGERMGFEDSFSLTNYVPPQESTTLNLILTAPTNPGIHRSGWLLRSDQGELFGSGPDRNNLFWVELRVAEPPPTYFNDFAASYCAATWENEFGTLPCPGDSSSQNGFVLRLESADLESHFEDEPLIWTQPSVYNNSWIRGIYPAIRIRDGDRFLADIGCLAGHPDCDVVFQLNYRIPGGVTNNLGEWREDEDGDITRINIDLSDLAGRSVELILTTLSNGSSDGDAAFWLVPHIVNNR